PRYQGAFYSTPPPPARLPKLDQYSGCALTTTGFLDPHPFQSFVAELADLAAQREALTYGVRHLMGHATDPNMSVAVSARDRFLASDFFPVDLGFLDIVYQNVYSYYPPYIRFIGYREYLQLAAQAYPSTPFVILECGYSTSPTSELGICA